jgi:hypothetical protein
LAKVILGNHDALSCGCSRRFTDGLYTDKSLREHRGCVWLMARRTVDGNSRKSIHSLVSTSPAVMFVVGRDDPSSAD